jgi:hypothetical protein
MSAKFGKFDHIQCETINGNLPSGGGLPVVDDLIASTKKLCITSRNPGSTASSLIVSNDFLVNTATGGLLCKQIVYPESLSGQPDGEFLLQQQSLSEQDLVIRNLTTGDIILEGNKLNLLVNGFAGNSGDVFTSNGTHGQWLAPQIPTLPDISTNVQSVPFVQSANTNNPNLNTSNSCRYIASEENLFNKRFLHISSPKSVVTAITNLTAVEVTSGIITVDIAGACLFTLPTAVEINAIISQISAGNTFTCFFCLPLVSTVAFLGNTNVTPVSGTEKTKSFTLHFVSNGVGGWNCFF